MKKLKLLMAFCALLIGWSNASAAAADYLTGWTEVTSLPTNNSELDQYYYVFVATEADLMLAQEWGAGKLGNEQEGKLTMVYRTPANPLSHKTMVWMLSYDETYLYGIRNLNNSTHFMQSREKAPWRVQFAWETAQSKWTRWNIAYASDSWTIENNACEDASKDTYFSNKYIGPWTEKAFADNNVVAGNKEGDNVGKFKIYRMLRTTYDDKNVTDDYLTNPSFENDDVSTLTVVGDKSASDDSYRGWTLAQPTGWTVDEQKASEFTRQLKDQDAYTDNGYGKVGSIPYGDYCYYFRQKWWNNTIVIKQTLENLPAGRYTLSVDIKAMKQGGNPKAYLSAGSEKSSDIAFVSGGDNLFTTTGWATPQVSFNVNSTGNVEIALHLEKDNTADAVQIAFYNFALTYEPFADAADYAALNAAIETAEAKLGFEVGDYAPYNNIPVATKYAEAKAIDQDAKNEKETIQALTTYLNTPANWTSANTEELNAIRWNKAEDYSSEGENKVPTGGFIGSDANSRISHNPTSNAGLAGLTQSMALMVVANTNATYGETEGYTLPLKATTVYEFKFKYAGWGECGTPTITILKGSETVKSVTLDAPAKTGNNNTDAWEPASVVFQTNAAGDYKVKFSTSDGRNAFGDLELKKVGDVSVTVGSYGYATYVNKDYDLDFSSTSIEAYKVKVTSKGVATLTKVNQVPAGTPVLLYKENGATEDIPVMIGAADVSDNDLVAGNSTTATEGVATTDGGYTNMILNVVNEKIGFYFANGQTVAEDRAYLHIATDLAPNPENNSRMAMRFAGNITGIDEAKAEAVQKDGKFFKNGKLVIFKNGKKFNASGAQIK